MNFNYTEDQLAIKDVADRMFADLCDDAQIKDIYESELPLHKKLWQELANAGLLVATLPEADGGSELGMTELGLILEAQGRGVAPIPLVETVVACAMPLAQFASQSLKDSLLPGIASGEKILVPVRPYEGLQEKTPLAATLSGDEVVLSGESNLVTYAPVAEGYLVTASTADGQPVVAYVEAGAEGVRLTPQKSVSAELAGHLSFDAVKVPASQVVATGDKAAEVIEWQTQRVYAAMAAQQVGVLQEGLKRAAEYTCERKQFGRPLAAFQAVAQQAADAYMAIEALRGVYWRAVDDLDNDHDDANPVLSSRVAKFWIAEAGHTAAHIFLHIHGGIGQDLDYPLHRFFLWAKRNENLQGGASAQAIALGDLIKAEPDAVLG